MGTSLPIANKGCSKYSSCGAVFGYDRARGATLKGGRGGGGGLNSDSKWGGGGG